MNTNENHNQFIVQPPMSKEQVEYCRQLARDLNVPLFLAELLFQRGFVTPEEAVTFLEPQLADLPEPTLLKGMDAAVELLLTAVRDREQIIIYGDYDVDGITATVLLTDFLRKLDLEVSYHIPNRMTDGYGLTMESIDRLAAKVPMPALLISVDCGITAVKEVQHAQELGFKVIVTDHHEPGSETPAANAVVNPKQKGCTFPCKRLSGVGVAFFLVMAVRRKMVEQGFWTRETMPNLREYLDLVALGTVADVMELVEVNRILVKAGLEVVTERVRPGVWALCERAGLDDGYVTAESISFQLAPRINAVGRLGRPQLAANLLLCKDTEKAMEYALALDEANKERKALERTALDDAVLQAEEQVEQGRMSLVLVGRDWHPGVVGIIAARMIDRFQLPSLVFTGDTATNESNKENTEMLKGSGRSIPGLNLFLTLHGCDEHIIQFGGHAMAAGMTVLAKDLAEFSKDFDQSVRAMEQEEIQPGVVIDRILHTEDSLEELVEGLFRMEPFGQGNPEPVFLLKNVKMHSVSRLREHLKFSLQHGSSQVHGIGFFMHESFETASGDIDLGFKLKKTSFRGRERIEVHAVNIAATC